MIARQQSVLFEMHFGFVCPQLEAVLSDGGKIILVLVLEVLNLLDIDL
jgi:hypothetical protein